MLRLASEFTGRLLALLETKSGLVILGFVVTTVGGSIVSSRIQVKNSENEHTFEMYKIRLNEGKALQKDILAESNARSFYLHQVVAQIAHPEQYTTQQASNFWDANVELAKDKWNKDLRYFHAQTRVLFSSTLADMLLTHTEDVPVIHDPVLEKLDEDNYRKTKPKTLHAALVDTHATVYHLLRKCPRDPECAQAALLKLAEKQLNYLGMVQSCFAYQISSELLQYPYGPQAQTRIEPPEQCVNYAAH